ncbi:MAG: PTS sugar transporter subunit IIA [Candidatus Omnitrophota bacterium]|nr:MAG: PTS sugar transporter subunit IIA [Candidatus Omnitrophota bacterium]
MKVSEYLRGEFYILDLKAQNKDETVREIADSLSTSKKILNTEKFISDVLERESLGSTGIGNSVAIPHARTQAVKGFVIGFGRSRTGVDFNALDGQKVNLVFLMGADPAELNLYLRILAELSKLLMNKSFREALILAQDAVEVINTVKKFEGA